MRPIVYLIGSGPGDPGLISARGARYLAAADVVLYDHLVHPRLLRYARHEAEKIDVGLAAPQPLDQEAINYLVVEKAREGKIVARLKWGDPFLFDRGGQEALFLHEHGVPFEVVPGIPAAIGTTSYAGVPLTYPGGGDTLTFVRIGEDEGKRRSAPDWKRLAGLDGTIVFYVASAQVAAVVSALLAHGRSAEEPSALIVDGTLPTQVATRGSLGDICALAGPSAGDRRTAILIAGRVAALGEHLRWFDSRPLFGKRILVTRPREQAAELVGLLESLGADPIEAPMIRILPPADFGPLDDLCAHVTELDWLVCSSANAVDAFMGRLLASSLDLRSLGSVRICAVGPSTGGRLERYGVKADLLPAESRAEEVVAAMLAGGKIEGQRIGLPRSEIGREVIGEELRKKRALVSEVVAYRTVPVELGTDGEPDVYRMLLERRIDVVTFTSPSAVANLVKGLGAEPAADLLKTTLVASIGPVTADAAARYGVATTIMPAQYTVPALVDAIVTYYERRS